MVPSTEQGQIGERRRAALRPVVEMMPLGHPYRASGEAAALIPFLERPPQRGRDGARPRPDLHDAPGRVVPQHHAAGVARQAAGRFL
jgi:hypothetical protein